VHSCAGRGLAADIAGHVREHQVAIRRESVDDGGDDRERVVVVADEMQHSHQQHRQRLAEIDELTRTGMIQDCLRIPQVSLDYDGIPAGLEGTGVGQDHRIVVDVHHPGTGVDVQGDLMHIALGGQPGADVHELGDPGLGGQVTDGPAQEPAVLHGHQLRLRRGLAHLQGSRPVSGEVVVTTEPEVIHPRRRRDRRINPERRYGAAGHATSSIRCRTGQVRRIRCP